MDIGHLLTIGGLIIGGIQAALGWVIGMIFSKLKDLDTTDKDLDKRIDSHKLHVAETYSSKMDIKDLKIEIVDQLNRIEKKLDSKQDK